MTDKLGRLTLTINDKIENDFRAEVAKRLGFRKGNLQKALEEALQDWIKKGRK